MAENFLRFLSLSKTSPFLLFTFTIRGAGVGVVCLPTVEVCSFTLLDGIVGPKLVHATRGQQYVMLRRGDGCQKSTFAKLSSTFLISFTCTTLSSKLSVATTFTF